VNEKKKRKAEHDKEQKLLVVFKKGDVPVCLPAFSSRGMLCVSYVVVVVGCNGGGPEVAGCNGGSDASDGGLPRLFHQTKQNRYGP
jgi:hypothetical protein